MSTSPTEIEYLPLAPDDDDVSILGPQKRYRRFAKAFGRCYVPGLLLIGLILGMILGRIRIGVKNPTVGPAVSFSYDPVSTIFESFVDM